MEENRCPAQERDPREIVEVYRPAPPKEVVEYYCRPLPASMREEWVEGKLWALRRRKRRRNLIVFALLALLAGMAAAPAYAAEDGVWIEEDGCTDAGALSEEAPGEAVSLDESWTWAANSAIHTGSATLYRSGASMEAPGRRNITVCVNAGHGTSGGSGAETLSHPDGTPKVTGGTTAEGAVYSTSISTGTQFLDGTPEASVTLMCAMCLKDLLLQDQK